MMRVLELKHYHDPGHGWYAVKRKVLIELGILDKVSSYSYQSKTGQTIYLEEDCDASLLARTCKEKGIEFKVVKDVYHNGYSPIRSYDGFKI